MSNQNSNVNAPTNAQWKPEASEPAPAPHKRGFAAMDRTQVRDLARKGGVAAHRAGTAHEFSSEEARAAGRKGGLATHSGRSEAPPAETATATDPKLS